MPRGKPKRKKPKDYNIRINDRGVFIPTHDRTRKKGGMGQLYVKGEKRYADLPTAIRAEAHATGSIREYAQKHQRHDREITSLQKAFAKGGLSERRKHYLKGRLNRVAESIEGGREVGAGDSEYRKAIVDNLENALAEDNPSRVAAILLKVRKYTQGRAKASQRELEVVPKRREALIREKEKRDQSVRKSLNRTYRTYQRIAEGNATEGELKNLERELARMPEWARKGTVYRHIKGARERLAGGDKSGAKKSMREANRAMARFASKFTLLKPEGLDIIGKTQNPSFMKDVSRHQLNYIKENLEYWHGPHAHEFIPVGQIREHLRKVGDLTPDAKMREAAHAAADNLVGRSRKRAGESKAILEKAIPKKPKGGRKSRARK